MDNISLTQTLTDTVTKQCLKPLSPLEGGCAAECVRFPKSELSLWICTSSTLLMQMPLAQMPHTLENHHGVKDTQFILTKDHNSMEHGEGVRTGKGEKERDGLGLS